MITKFLLDVLFGAISWVGGLIPELEKPAWWTNVQTTMAGLDRINDFAWFIPVNAIGLGCVFMLTATALATGIYITRTMFSMASGGGGAT